MIRPDDSQLLLALHNGAFEQPLWAEFLDRLRERTGTALVSLIFRQEKEDRVHYLFSGEDPPPEQQKLFREKFARDPLPYHSMREGRVYAQEELVEPRNREHRAYYDEIILPWGLSQSRNMRVTERDGLSAWLGCAGGPGIGWSAISALMSTLAPHLRMALCHYSAFERERMRVNLSSEPLERRDFGWLTLDRRCHIVDASPHMEQLLERSHALYRDRYGRLTPHDPALDQELSGLVKQYAATGAGLPKAIRLSFDPQMEMLIRPIADDRPIASATPFPQVAICYISGDQWSHADRVDQLVDLFGLLPSEARLAWAMGRGLSISDAAQELGLRVETARNYSKKIYAKTGASGQPELVRIILTSVLALG